MAPKRSPSKLDPFDQPLLDMHAQGLSYREMTLALEHQHGTSVSHRTVHNWFHSRHPELAERPADAPARENRTPDSAAATSSPDETLDRLRRDHLALQEENARLRSDAVLLRAERARLEAELAPAGERLARLRQENESLRQENKILREETAALRQSWEDGFAPAYEPLSEDEDWRFSYGTPASAPVPASAGQRRRWPLTAAALLLALAGILVSPLLPAVPLLETAARHGGLLAAQGLALVEGSLASVSLTAGGLMRQASALAAFLHAQPGLGMFLLVAGVLAGTFAVLGLRRAAFAIALFAFGGMFAYMRGWWFAYFVLLAVFFRLVIRLF